MAENTKPFILIPLYIYPSPDAWLPILTAAISRPDLSFKVVINPANGPGETTLPDINYQAALSALTRLANVEILGYIHCTWGQRPFTELKQDVLTYADWPRKWRQGGELESVSSTASEVVRIDGIFIDETPCDLECTMYLGSITGFIRGTFGKATTVVHNPGVVVDAILYDHADYVVAFENFASRWASNIVQDALRRLPDTARAKTIILVHSCASHEKQLDLGERVWATYGFPGQLVTTCADYTDWCPHWESYWQGFARWTTQK
jgi:hypothetical protein